MYQFCQYLFRKIQNELVFTFTCQSVLILLNISFNAWQFIIFDPINQIFEVQVLDQYFGFYLMILLECFLLALGFIVLLILGLWSLWNMKYLIPFSQCFHFVSHFKLYCFITRWNTLGHSQTRLGFLKLTQLFPWISLPVLYIFYYLTLLSSLTSLYFNAWFLMQQFQVPIDQWPETSWVWVFGFIAVLIFYSFRISPSLLFYMKLNQFILIDRKDSQANIWLKIQNDWEEMLLESIGHWHIFLFYATDVHNHYKVFEIFYQFIYTELNSHKLDQILINK